MPYANNKGVGAFLIRCLDSTISLVSIFQISSLYLASIAEQTGLSFTWTETPKTGFLVTRLESSKSIGMGTLSYARTTEIFEPRHEKTFLRGLRQVILKPACVSTEANLG